MLSRRSRSGVLCGFRHPTIIPMRRSPTIAVLASLAVGAAASAHPDYEKPVTTVKGAKGENLKVVLHHTDGIVGADPVKLQVVDTAGKVLAETPYGRDYVTLEAGDGRLYAFGVDMAALSFWNAWQLDRGTLTELPASPGLALVATLRERWLLYGVLAVFYCTAVTDYIRRAMKAARRFVKFTWLQWMALVGIPAMFLHGPLSVLLLAGLTLFGLLPVYLVLRYDGGLESRGY